MQTIQLTNPPLPDSEELELLGGHFLDENFMVVPCGHECLACTGELSKKPLVTTVVRETSKVIRPDGKTLLIYIKDCIPRNLCEVAFRVLKQVPIEGAGDNRGLAAGLMKGEDDDKINRSHGSFGKLSGRGTRYHTKKQDGTVSRTTYAAAVNSAVIGYFDRYPRIPYCRQTVFNLDNPELWEELVPYIQRVSAIFKEYAPEVWASQKAFVDKIHPDFKIEDSIFTTLTVNRNWQTAVHQDAGDYASGLGCMSVLQGGNYEGAELAFPKYGCAVDMRTGGVALADVHQWHGNAPRKGLPGHHVRISCVFYARQNMVDCGSAEFEMERARQVGDDLANRHAAVSSQKKLF